MKITRNPNQQEDTDDLKWWEWLSAGNIVLNHSKNPSGMWPWLRDMAKMGVVIIPMDDSAWNE